MSKHTKGRAGKNRRREVGAFYGKTQREQGAAAGNGAQRYHLVVKDPLNGAGAIARRLRQAARLELKKLRKEHGITSPMFQGMGPGGALLLEVPAAGEKHLEAYVVDEGLIVPANAGKVTES